MKKLLLSLLLTSTICLGKNTIVLPIDENALKTTIEKNPLSCVLITKILQAENVQATAIDVRSIVIKATDNSFQAVLIALGNRGSLPCLEFHTLFANVEKTLGTEFANAIKDMPAAQEAPKEGTAYFAIDSLTKCMKSPAGTHCVTQLSHELLGTIAKTIK